MQPHQERVVEEKRELDEKLGKLALFFASDPFGSLPVDEQSRMLHQQDVMIEYSRVLGDRVEHF